MPAGHRHFPTLDDSCFAERFVRGFFYFWCGGFRMGLRLRGAAGIAVSAGLAIASGAQASTVAITGSSFGTDGVGSFVGYGTSINKNNVVGYGPSKLSDPYKGSAWLTEGKSKSSAVFSTVPNYQVSWYFVGAESGHANLFTSLALSYMENDQNNRYQAGNDPGPVLIGTTVGTGIGPIAFSITDTIAGQKLSNGANQSPSAFVASLMFAYVEPLYNKKGNLKGWTLSKVATDWFAFGYDDPGSSNDDHDDFMGVAHVQKIGAPVTPTPLPGAFMLMTTLASAGYFMLKRKLRAP